MKHTISVQMFGNFLIEYDGKPLNSDRMHRDGQFTRMMQVMLHYSESGIAKNRLEEYVVGEREIDEPHTALRVIVYKTKKKLEQLGLDGQNWIYLKDGMYYWTDEIEVAEDARIFERRYEQAEAIGQQDETGAEEKLQLYLEACYLYKGDFLHNYSGETWVAHEARHYREIFGKCVNNAAALLKEKKDWKTLEELGRYAANVEPLNNWEILTMEALVETGRSDEASNFYSEVEDYYLKECGAYPSVHLMEIFEKYSDQMSYSHEILEDIQMKMDEGDISQIRGGYFCSYPVFRGIYQTSVRMMGRTGIPVYLMLCTLVDKDGKQMQSEAEINRYSGQLKDSISESIRRSDVYVKYGKIQFLILLAGITHENCELVQNRINHRFRKKQPQAGSRYHVNSVICELSGMMQGDVDMISMRE